MDVSWEKTQNGENCLTVQDTGIGCSSELLKHIFDPFVVEDSKTKMIPKFGSGKKSRKMKNKKEKDGVVESL